MARNVDLERMLGADMAHGKDMTGKSLGVGNDAGAGNDVVPNLTLNIKNLHLHFDERMNSRTYYGRQPWEDDGCESCEDCEDPDDCEDYEDFEEDEDCGDYGGYEEDYDCDDPDEEESYDEDEDDENPYNKTFTFDEVVESVHDATGLCKTVIAEVLERHRAAKKPVPTVKPVPTADRFVRKGADYERR